jgi:hypothetical protein
LACVAAFVAQPVNPRGRRRVRHPQPGLEVVNLRDLNLDIAQLASRQERSTYNTAAAATGAQLFGTPAELVAHLADQQLLIP